MKKIVSLFILYIFFAISYSNITMANFMVSKIDNTINFTSFSENINNSCVECIKDSCDCLVSPFNNSSINSHWKNEIKIKIHNLYTDLIVKKCYNYVILNSNKKLYKYSKKQFYIWLIWIIKSNC